jgi:putative ABC transport system substrate-binding protein
VIRRRILFAIAFGMAVAGYTVGRHAHAGDSGAVQVSATGNAQEPVGIPRVGELMFGGVDDPAGEGLRDGLRELGYIEGKSIVLDWRASGAAEGELRPVAVDLARAKADLIVVGSTPAARAALEATTLPIVFLVGDPIAAGFAASFAKPGGRATGVSMITTELAGKRVELLRTITPKAGRVIFMMNSANPASTWQLEEALEASRTLGVQLVPLDVQAAGGIDAALSQLPRRGAGGVVVAAETVFLDNRAKIARAVRKAKLPAIFPASQYHDAGILMSYGPNLRDVGRRLSTYVDKILRGANPADLPIERLSKFELVINLRMARELGIEVPDTLRLRADRVIR